MEDTAAVVSRYAEEFAAVYAEKVAFWRRTLEELRRQGKRAVVWGSGSKGVTFLNTLAAGETITHVVDINPRKHGRFVAGTGQEIISPDRLASLKPEIVIIMNSIYREEIGGTLHSLGVHAEIMGA
jgi:FlaA1/EpsC-like NDP-sugar epimerase